jgi:Ca2+/Na+ antiporter
MDSLIALALFIATAIYLVKRNATQLLVWLVLTYLVTYNCFVSSRTIAVLLGIVAMYVVCYVSTREGFEEEKKLEEKEKTDSPEPSGKSTPHVDLGTTILHAYRNLSPEQIGGMKKDTKELMELQKELMGTLAEMKPAIEQGAELLGTFSQFFGKQ